MVYNLQEYKGIWWMYDKITDRWVVSESEDYCNCHLMLFKGEYLITECFKMFENEKQKYRT